MKKALFILITLIIIATFFNGCFYRKEELVYPQNLMPCDTSAIRYSVDIINILSNNCYECHGGSATGSGGIKLDTYTGIKAMASNGNLLQAITHTGSVTPMPKDRAMLPVCLIAKIRTWIRNGAPNN